MTTPINAVFNAPCSVLVAASTPALVAVIAAAALGSDRVQAMLMPSPWSSDGSIDDAEALAKPSGGFH